jgi:small subunit ribosomal protein S9
MADDEQPAAPSEAESVEEIEAQADVVATPAETPEAPEAQADAPAEAAEVQPQDAPAEAPQAQEQAEPEAVEEPAADAGETVVEDEEEEEEPAPREKPAVPGAHLEVDIVPEGVDPLGRSEGYEDTYAVDPYATDEDTQEEQVDEEEREEELAQPISTAAIDLASGARYRATGKRKSAIARVTLRPGTGSYIVNGRTLENHFPRLTLQRNIRQPLETVGYQDRMDVVARLHGGGISAQAGALRHGVSRALLEADPNLRGELKRRGFLTRDSRAKERKKAGLKKARKRPQFSKR